MVNKILGKIQYYIEIISLNFLRFGQEKIGENNQSASSKLNDYILSVRKFTRSDRAFKKFKMSKIYQVVLEHVSYELANNYLNVINNNYPNYLNKDKLKLVKENDRIGKPFLFKLKYNSIRGEKSQINELEISGSSIRYLFVLCEIERIFKKKNYKLIAEIGGGYGGQALIFDKFFQFDQYMLFDLPSVNNFIKKYLNSFYFNNSFNALDINQQNYNTYFDLVISNYSFSELPRNLQEVYLKKIILKSNSGYMTMNTGNDVTADEKTNKYSASELLKIIPNSQIIEEVPLSSKDNYVLIWNNTNE